MPLSRVTWFEPSPGSPPRTRMPNSCFLCFWLVQFSRNRFSSERRGHWQCTRVLALFWSPGTLWVKRFCALHAEPSETLAKYIYIYIPQTVLALRGSYFFCIEYALESAKTCGPPCCLDLPSSFYEKQSSNIAHQKPPVLWLFIWTFFMKKTFKNRASKTPSFLTFYLDALLPRLA